MRKNRESQLGNSNQKLQENKLLGICPIAMKQEACKMSMNIFKKKRMSTHIRETQGQLLAEELLLHVKENHKLRTLQCLWELLSEELPHKTRKFITCGTLGQTIKR